MALNVLRYKGAAGVRHLRKTSRLLNARITMSDTEARNYSAVNTILCLYFCSVKTI